MKQKRSPNLMSYLLLCFAAILFGVLAVVVVSWKMTLWESKNSLISAELTEPYTRLYSGLNKLSVSQIGLSGLPDSKSEINEILCVLQNIEEESSELEKLLNEGGYNRASIDFFNTFQGYQERYLNVLHNYEQHDYDKIYTDFVQLDQFEHWLRLYLETIGNTIAERQSILQEQTSAIRSIYYRVILVSGSLIFIFCSITLVLIARRFVVPIEVLCKSVQTFSLTNNSSELLERGIPCKTNSLKEIRTLATSIYNMQLSVLKQYSLEKHNEQLKEELAEEAMRAEQIERQLQETQLKALQAQINPHFLYNTLNMICQMSYIEKADRTSELLETFSDYFRYNVESFSRNVTLYEELTNVRGYIAIQKERFGDRIRYIIDYDSTVDGIEVPSLIIQPLVENAITHGLHSKLKNGLINISVKSSETVLFEICVTDNGIGMDQKTLQELVKAVSVYTDEEQMKHNTIGLSNVIQRLRLVFGKRLAFELSSEVNEGFSIRLYVVKGAAV